MVCLKMFRLFALIVMNVMFPADFIQLIVFLLEINLEGEKNMSQ
jgi:hypothetical protein